MEKRECRSALLGAGGQHGPNPRAPAAAGFATRPLRDFAIDHDESKALLDRVVRRLDPVCFQESEIVVTVFTKSLCDVLGFVAPWWTAGHFEHLAFDTFSSSFPAVRQHLIALMPNAEETFDGCQQLLAEAARDAIGQRREELHVSDQMRPAELHACVDVMQEFAVRAVVVAADNTSKGFPQELLEHSRASSRIDVE